MTALERLQKLVEAQKEATAGPWVWRTPGYLCNKYIDKGLVIPDHPEVSDYITRGNRDFIAACGSTDFKAILEFVQELQARLGDVLRDIGYKRLYSMYEKLQAELNAYKQIPTSSSYREMLDSVKELQAERDELSKKLEDIFGQNLRLRAALEKIASRDGESPDSMAWVLSLRKIAREALE